MIFVWTFLLLIGLAGLGYVLFLYLSTKTPNYKKIDSVEALLSNRKESNKYKGALLLFGFFVSTLYVTFAFDADYKILVEKKLYVQEVDDVDTLIAMYVSAPPPPQKIEEIKPEVIEEDVAVPEIKLVEKLEKKPTIDNTPTPVPGPPGPPSPPKPPGPSFQSPDNTIYPATELTSPPKFPGGDEACTLYLSNKLYSVRAPNKYRVTNSTYTIYVDCVIEIDGKISRASISRKFKTELSDETINKIISEINSMPNWIPGMLLEEPKRAYVSLPITLP
jgi:hypothetical protein